MRKRSRRDFRKEAQSFFTMGNRLDFERIVAQILYTDPSVFVKACTALGYNGAVSTPHWYEEMTRVARSEGKIPAIKFIRGKVNTTLLEAKQMVDDYMNSI